MKKFYYSFVTLLAFLFTVNIAQAQIFEDFEDGSKGSYAAGSVTLSTGDWFMDEALLGSLSNDKYNGDQGVRMDRRDGIAANIYMEFDKSDGADEVSFYAANYGSSSGNKLQVQYSTDQGSTWNDVGDEIEVTETLQQYSVSVGVQGDIRFKFIHTAGDDRMNIDDIRVSDYIEPADDATIAVSVDGSEAQDGATVEFPTTTVDDENTKTIEIRNIGNQALEISNVSVSGGGFSISSPGSTSLAFNEKTELTLTFSPGSEGGYQGTLNIESNAANVSSFELNVQGDAIAGGTVIPITEARDLELGTEVTVSGHLTVTDEFQGPVYFQDETGGIAWFNNELMRGSNGFSLDVNRGDSIVVTGQLDEFNDLLQITGSDVEYEIFPEGNKDVEPVSITVEQMNSGNFEGRLVSMEVDIEHTGALQSDEYDITDNTGTGVLYINDDTEVVGASAPDGTTTIVGVVGIFRGTYQLLPRDLNDIDAESFEYPGEEISKDQTFEIATWNIEWFGSTSSGPDDEETQFANVKQVIDSVDADLYAFQEVSSTSQFADLVAELDAYGGIVADFSQTQKTAYLFKRATVDSLDSDVITGDFFTQQYWANGRYPLMFKFNATVNGESREMYAFNIHAKAFDDAGSYNQRENASIEMKGYLDNLHSSDNVIFLGDYNDTTIGSITSGEDSPYTNFDSDDDYIIVTKNLEQKGFASQAIGSFIDHITISSELSDEYIMESERVENTSYIGSYLSSTSDHYPVWTRLQFEEIVSSNEELFAEAPKAFELGQNYPNPFNPTTEIKYTLATNSSVTLKVYDMLGREVVTLVNNERKTSGSHQVTFDAGNLSSGMYIYQLSTTSGLQLTKKMMLIK